MSDDSRRHVADAISYADRIAGRPDLASEHARLAAARFLRDLDAARPIFIDPDRFHIELNLAALTHGDYPTRVATGIQLLRAGAISANELRAELGYNPHRDGDRLVMQATGGRPEGTGDGDRPPALNGGPRLNGAAAARTA